jgi:hypothetical protein
MEKTDRQIEREREREGTKKRGNEKERERILLEEDDDDIRRSSRSCKGRRYVKYNRKTDRKTDR